MGGSSFKTSDYDAREAYRSSTGTSAFVHDDNIRAGVVEEGCDPKMNPFGIKWRESRDSPEHPVTIPIGVSKDLTGSMSGVPKIFQKALARLMNQFLEVKASGKKYLGEGYPAICIAGHDDYEAQRNLRLHSVKGLTDAELKALPAKERAAANNDAKLKQAVHGTIQMGQFESGLEIDDDLGRIWFTRNGGGGGWESYELMLYAFARHTAHDHYDKRGKKGYLFLFGDEKPFGVVSKEQVKVIFGDDIQEDIPIADMIAECGERYHIFYVMPKMTSNWKNADHLSTWRKLLGEEMVLLLEEPEKICELIVSTVTMFEENASLEDLMTDNVATGLDKALVPLVKRTGGGVAKYDASNLPAMGAGATPADRL